MAAASAAMASPTIVSLILRRLSDMKYKDRRQYGPDQPVEFLEFRPTLVPSILVNKLWADAGTSILWRRYPHLPALMHMSSERRQCYANKVERLFALGPLPSSDAEEEALDYLRGLEWPHLRSLELEVDWKAHGARFLPMLHAGLESLELSGCQSGGSDHFVHVVLPALFRPCPTLKSIHFGPETLDDADPVHVSALFEHLDATPSVNDIGARLTGFQDKDALFARLSQRPGLESLDMDLEPGIALLPLLSGPNALPSPFPCLKKLSVICYPEVALALPVHLQHVEEMQMDIARIPDQTAQESDYAFLSNLIRQLSLCSRLRLLRIGIGPLASDFPSTLQSPRLHGDALVKLAGTCPRLQAISISAIDPSAIDASTISSEQFDTFCRRLPHLQTLSLKLDPTSAPSLEKTALQSLGEHCKQLEVLRLKLPFHLPRLPVPRAVPQILINGQITPNMLTAEEKSISNTKPAIPPDGNLPLASSLHSAHTSPTATTTTPPPLFPFLTHLAISRPSSPLSSTLDDSFDPSSAGPSSTPSSSSHSSLPIDPDLEESLVRSWAHPLLIHFPRLEILEAWGDSTGTDNESLNYFLPLEEILASTWEFLSGVEQDLWEGSDEDEEDEVDGEYEEGKETVYAWYNKEAAGYSGSTDWERASLIDAQVRIQDAYRKGYEEGVSIGL